MITGAQIAAARELFEWPLSEFANKAKLRPSVVMRAEASPGEPVPTTAQMDALLQTLKAAGIEFTAGEPGVKLARKSGC
ncbi:helix-turn-helix domain-containing protein [Methylobacterium planeticum]|uniref:Transcriptional regulator n=1 Tax=Methylobacterium planeticum TaxID=2615211 RepID=A0A6N6MU07_9HYPH|nr:transcriptional regulator [Methylobacterium planeticum]KAB1072197.1 transcriptional regulator [Methylobacterium planeticum]